MKLVLEVGALQWILTWWPFMLSGHWASQFWLRFYFHSTDGVKLQKIWSTLPCCLDSCPSCPNPVRLTWRNTRSMWHPKFEVLSSRRFRRLAWLAFSTVLYRLHSVLFPNGIWIETLGIWHILLTWGWQCEMNWNNCMTVCCGRFGTWAWNSQNSSISSRFSTNIFQNSFNQKIDIDGLRQKLPNLQFQKPMCFFFWHALSKATAELRATARELRMLWSEGLKPYAVEICDDPWWSSRSIILYKRSWCVCSLEPSNYSVLYVYGFV